MKDKQTALWLYKNSKAQLLPMMVLVLGNKTCIFLKPYLPYCRSAGGCGASGVIMGDLQFIRKYRGSIEELNVVFVGEVTNLCMSWFEAAVKFPIKVTQIAPKGYEASEYMVKMMNNDAIGQISTSTDIDLINEKTDLIYTDCWPYSYATETQEQIKERFLPYQITTKQLSRLMTSQFSYLVHLLQEDRRYRPMP